MLKVGDVVESVQSRLSSAAAEVMAAVMLLMSESRDDMMGGGRGFEEIQVVIFN